MKKYSIILLFLACSSMQAIGQLKLGSSGIGGTLGFKNNFSFRIYPNHFVKEKKEIGFELQYSHIIYSEDMNKIYIGIGAGYKWVNLHEINNGFLSNDYEVARIYIPIGAEYFPIYNNNKFSFQLESGPQLDLSRLELDPGRTLHFYYHLRGIIEFNYYFRRNTNSKY